MARAAALVGYHHYIAPIRCPSVLNLPSNSTKTKGRRVTPDRPSPRNYKAKGFILFGIGMAEVLGGFLVVNSAKGAAAKGASVGQVLVAAAVADAAIASGIALIIIGIVVLALYYHK